MADVTIEVAAADEGASELIASLQARLAQIGAAGTQAGAAVVPSMTAASGALKHVGTAAKGAGAELTKVHERVDRTEFRQARALDAIVTSLGAIVQGGHGATKAVGGVASGLQILSITLPHLFALAAAFSLVVAGIEAVTKAREEDEKAEIAEQKRHDEATKATIARSRSQSEQLEVDRAHAEQLERRAQAQHLVVNRLTLERIHLEKELEHQLATTGTRFDETALHQRRVIEELSEATVKLTEHRREAEEANTRLIASEQNALRNLQDQQRIAAEDAGLTAPQAAAHAVEQLHGTPFQQEVASNEAASVIFKQRKKQLEDEIRTRNLLGAALERQTALNQGLSIAEANELATLAGGAAFATRLKQLRDESAAIGLVGHALTVATGTQQGMSRAQAETIAHLADENAARTKAISLIQSYGQALKAGDRQQGDAEKAREQDIENIIEGLRRENRERTASIAQRTLWHLQEKGANEDEINAALRQAVAQDQLADALENVQRITSETSNMQVTLTARLDELTHQREQGMISERQHTQLTKQTYIDTLALINQQIAALEVQYQTLKNLDSEQARDVAREIGRLTNESAQLMQTLMNFRSENEQLAIHAADSWRSGMESILTNILTTGEHIHGFFRQLLLDVTQLIRQIIAQYAAARLVRAIFGAAGAPGFGGGVPSGASPNIAGEGTAGVGGTLAGLSIPQTVARPSFAIAAVQPSTAFGPMHAEFNFEHNSLDPRSGRAIMESYEPVFRQMFLKFFRESSDFKRGAERG